MPLLQDGDELGALNDASFLLDPKKEATAAGCKDRFFWTTKRSGAISR